MALQREEEERRRQEEEEERRAQEEADRLAEEARKLEDARLKKAIEEQVEDMTQRLEYWAGEK